MTSRPKIATVLLVDVGRAMRAPFSGGGGMTPTQADVALGLARSMLQQILLFTPKHEVGVVLFGATETKNDLMEDGYQYVFVARDSVIDAPDIAMMRFILAERQGGEKSDAVDGLIVSLDLLIKRTAEKKYQKTIRLITNCSAVAAGDPDLGECVRQLEATDTRLQVTLVDAATAGGGAWTSLANTCGHVELVPLERATSESAVCVRPVEQRAKVRLQLVVSPEVQIPVGIYSKTTAARLPTLKRRSKLAAGVPKEHQRTDKVITERTYHVADDPDGEEVKQEDRIKGHKYGQSIVPMSEYDEAALMYSCERTLTALGFAPVGCVGAEHSIYQIEVVAADRGDRWAHCAFESLARAMLIEGRVLVARYCFRPNTQPRMVALIPQAAEREGVSSHMVMQYLPFAEDIRDWPFASLPPVSKEQLDTAKLLVASMDLDAMVGPDSVGELLRPEETHNPSLKRFYDFLIQRAIDPSARVPPAGREVLATLEVPARGSELLQTVRAAERLREAFGLQRIEKPSVKKKRFWREAVAEKRKDSAFGEVDTKRIKVDVSVKKDEKKEDDEAKDELAGPQAVPAVVGTSVGMAPAVTTVPEPLLQVHIGSVHPERDFERWLEHRAGGVDTVGPAIEQMCRIIERLTEEGDDFLGKALTCVATLRRGCVREGEAAAYNDFVRNVRAAATPRRGRLWEKARDLQLGLITDSEVPTSTVTAEEARLFLSGAEVQTAPQPCSDRARLLSDRDLEDLIE